MKMTEASIYKLRRTLRFHYYHRALSWGPALRGVSSLSPVLAELSLLRVLLAYFSSKHQCLVESLSRGVVFPFLPDASEN